ncbi:FAD/FMN-containing isoamyl alcohol oxidase-like protein MreA [Periconia macrospinosa]|uniref:FAD/FMN-containing isoamyl alcohol oxidase-like protein MreA n=1 Tax=Periconia macrospinosa TaxID=97972 RepID=A0A2V1DXJ2_9PLEO|nr:FAD/FMN-containing isoamyl alcohol oxidase-like protein MreA [Periconia macrospinosa]
MSLANYLLIGALLSSPVLGASPSLLNATYPPLASSNHSCRCFPGDECWPNQSTWDTLNSTVGGKLVKTVPLGSPCHDSTFGAYDEGKCKSLQDQWLNPELHINTTSSIMAPFWAIQSCNPFASRDGTCVVGQYVQYAVDAHEEGDYKAAIQFARDHNIRLVIRNTAHDWLGKSSGAGALALRTHNLKNVEVVDYSASYYSGKALKVGAGVSLMEAFQASHDNGYVNVGGTSPTVGIAGGYTQGTGHGLTVSAFGLGADQALEWEVVTAQGDILKATPENENSDLYWALSGGGAGTYAAVLSLTIKLHKDSVTSAMNMSWTADGIDQSTYYAGITAFSKILPEVVDAGIGGNWVNSNTSFSVAPFVGAGKTKEEIDAVFQPLVSELKALNINFTYYSAEFPTFLDMYKEMNPFTEMGIFQIGSRLIPRGVIETKSEDFVDALKKINEQGAWISGLAYNASTPKVDNAVNPTWRSSIISLVAGTFYDYQNFDNNIANQKLMTETLLPELSRVIPGEPSAYSNEGDPWEPEWQKVFYGENYKRLLDIKLKYDPESTLYARTAVGSEAWIEKPDGRLCKA